MVMSIRTSTRTSRADNINTDLGGGAKVQFRSGSAPASVNDAATGTLLAECTCNATSFSAAGAVNGVLTAQNVAGQSYKARDDSANATGTIGYARITDSGGNAILQFSTVGTTGGSEEVILPSLSVAAGEPVEVESIVITEGNG